MGAEPQLCDGLIGIGLALQVRDKGTRAPGIVAGGAVQQLHVFLSFRNLVGGRGKTPRNKLQ